MSRPTQERLQELFHYDAETGVFTRKKPSPYNPKDRKYGRQGAGRISELGYVLIMVDGVNYIAGPLAWQYVHSVWPRRVKYVNGNPLDNRIANISVHDKSKDEIKGTRLTHDRLKELVHYEPETGHFTWRVISSVANIGDRAGGGHGNGYRQIGLDYKKYLEHVLAWFYMTGQWPENEVDHDNRNKSDNRWSNLVAATRSQNGHNKGANKRNKLGFPGVMVHGNGYRARISFDGDMIDLGVFPTIAQARIARLLAEKKYLGKFTSFDAERDGALPFGSKFLAAGILSDRLLILVGDKLVEITDAHAIEVVPVTAEGEVLQ